MAKFTIKTAKKDDPIYREGITISSSLGAAMMRARDHYKEHNRVKTVKKNKGNREKNSDGQDKES